MDQHQTTEPLAYEPPTITDHGTFTDLTLGSKNHSSADSLVGAPIDDFS